MSRRIATIAARAGVDTDPAQGAVMPPLYLSSNYSFAGFAQKRRYDYTRSGNPTRDVLAGALAELEGGAGGVVTSSGMSAITLLTAQLKPEDLLIAPHDCYGGATACSRRRPSAAFTRSTSSISPIRQRSPLRLRASRRSSGSRRRAIRCCVSRTSPQ